MRSSGARGATGSGERSCSPISFWHAGYDRALARFTDFLSALSLVAAVAFGARLCNAMRASAGAARSLGEGLMRG